MENLRPSSRFAISAAALCLTLGLIPPAAAQHRLSDDVVAKARQLSSVAERQEGSGELAKALELYHSSWRLVHSYSVASAMGRIELELKQYTDAAEHLTFALWFGPMETTEEIERERQALRHDLSRALREIAQIRIEVESPNSVNSITVNGRPLSLRDSPWGAYVHPGEHRVVVRYAEAKPLVRVVRVATGKNVTLKFLRPAADSESERPRAMQTWGGGMPPPDDREPVDRSAFKSDAHRAVFIGGAALTVVGAVVGAYGLARAHATARDHDRLATELGEEAGSAHQACASPVPSSRASRCAELDDLERRRDTERTVGTIGLASFGVFAAGTAAALVLWPEDNSRPRRAATRAWISATPTSSGVEWAVIGRF